MGDAWGTGKLGLMPYAYMLWKLGRRRGKAAGGEKRQAKGLRPPQRRDAARVPAPPTARRAGRALGGGQAGGRGTSARRLVGAGACVRSRGRAAQTRRGP